MPVLELPIPRFTSPPLVEEIHLAQLGLAVPQELLHSPHVQVQSTSYTWSFSDGATLVSHDLG
jgi:hypothetical protein